MSPLLDRYVDYLQEELVVGSSGVRLMPGVRELLDALEARDGRRARPAHGQSRGGRPREAQLRRHRSRLAFEVGAYGSDHELRGELPAVAQRRAREELGLEIAGSDVVVIGDTPADLHCGRGIGARAIGVATGTIRSMSCREHEPAAVFRGSVGHTQRGDRDPRRLTRFAHSFHL